MALDTVAASAVRARAAALVRLGFMGLSAWMSGTRSRTLPWPVADSSLLPHTRGYRASVVPSILRHSAQRPGLQRTTGSPGVPLTLQSSSLARSRRRRILPEDSVFGQDHRYPASRIEIGTDDHDHDCQWHGEKHPRNPQMIPQNVRASITTSGLMFRDFPIIAGSSKDPTEI